MTKTKILYYYVCSNCRAGVYHDVKAEYGDPYRCPRCWTPMRFTEAFKQESTDEQN